MLSDYAKIGERIAEIQGKNSEDARRELARIACVEFAESASLPKSAEPPKNAFGKILSMVAIAGAAIGMPFTGGLSGAALLAATIAPAGGAVALAGIGLAGNAGSKSANGDDVIKQTIFQNMLLKFCMFVITKIIKIILIFSKVIKQTIFQ